MEKRNTAAAAIKEVFIVAIAIMKSVYQHTFTSQRIAVDNQIDAYFGVLLNQD